MTSALVTSRQNLIQEDLIDSVTPEGKTTTFGFAAQSFAIQTEGKNDLDTDRHSFMSRILRDSPSERPKWLAFDFSRNEKVVLHKTCSKFDNMTPVGMKHSPCLDRDIFREVILMRCTRKCPFILTYYGFALDRAKDIYISTEHFDGESLETIGVRNPTNMLPEAMMKSVSWQILHGLHYLHSIKIVHNKLDSSAVLIQRVSSNSTSNQLNPVEYRVKLRHFRQARDQGAPMPKCDKLRCNSLEGIHASPRRDVCDSSYDVLCFGHLLFRCITGYKPWNKSCSCDQEYVTHCRRFVKVASRGKKPTNELLQRSQTFELNKKLALDVLPSLRALRVNLNTKHEEGNGKLWKRFSSSFSKVLMLLLAPSDRDRPAVGNVMAVYDHIFDPSHRDCPNWFKDRRGHLLASCIS
ncbi:serine/threonine-protein kinase SBK1-like [Ciona intestinalis]